MISKETLYKWKTNIDNGFSVVELSQEVYEKLGLLSFDSLIRLYDYYQRYPSFKDAINDKKFSSSLEDFEEYIKPIIIVFFEVDYLTFTLYEKFNIKHPEFKVVYEDFKMFKEAIANDSPELVIFKKTTLLQPIIAALVVFLEEQAEEDDDEHCLESEQDFLDNINFDWRDIQKKGVMMAKEQGFKSGLNVLIMGAGKSYMILKEIQLKYEEDLQNGKTNMVYMLLTDRQEILKGWFFCLNKDTGKYEFDMNKVNRWKESKIIDLTAFDMVETLFTKDNFLVEKLNLPASKPRILIVNTAFLRTGAKYMKLNYGVISCGWVDECHLVSAPQIFQALYHMRYTLNIELIGFSATPLRNTKNSLENIKKIFSNDPSGISPVNLLCFYSLFDALKDGIVLPFKHIIVEGKFIKGKGHHRVESSIIKEVYEKEVINNPEVPYKKGIGWCKRMVDVKPGTLHSFYDLFAKEIYNTPERIYYTVSSEKNNSIELFSQQKTDSFLLCVGRCREGSDIEHLDHCVYLDKVKKRSLLIALQTSGRVMRPDEEKKKKYALIIECVVREEGKPLEVITASKVMEYYKGILKMGQEFGVPDFSNVEAMLDLLENTYIDEKKQTVTVKIDSNPNHDCMLQLNVKDLDWSKFKVQLQQDVEKAVFKDELEVLKHQYSEAVKKNQGLGIRAKKEYFERSDVEPDPEKKFKEVWKGWYDFLGVDTSLFPKTKEEWVQICKKLGVNSTTDYYSRISTNPALPTILTESYSIFSNIEGELGLTNNSIDIW